VQLVRNSTQIGTIQNSLNSTYTQYVENITGFNHGDVLELQAQCGSATQIIYVRNFRILYNKLGRIVNS